MKLKYIISTMLVYVVVASTSCKDDFLAEKKDYSGYNEEVFKDPLLGQAYVDYVYSLFLPANNAQAFIISQSASPNGSYNDVWTKTTEELAGQTDFNKEWGAILNTNAHANQYFGQRMTSNLNNNTWTRLKQINIFLEEVDKYGMDEASKKKLKGQLYFWRAWQYFELVRLYGGVPLVLKAQNPIGAGEESQIPRSKTSECIEQICADLDQAVAMLPAKWPDAEWGRITQGAAAAFKGRVLLTWASPLFNRQDDRARWQRAYDANLAAKTMLEANGSKLFDTGGAANGTAWGNMWFVERNNPEAVIVFGFNNLTTGNPQRNSGWEQATRPKEINGDGSVSPTKEMVDAFPMKDGKKPGLSTYPYSLNKFYKNRDPRFYKTFAYNGALWPYAGNTSYRQWTYVWKGKASDAGFTKTTETKGFNSSGIYLCKATSPNANNTIGNFKNSGTDFMEMRFAEVVLNLAESAIGVDKFSEGLDGIIAIRKRAGVENLDGSYGLASAVGNRDSLFAAVLNERKVEFAYEGKRFWDLRRWMLFDDSFGQCSRLNMKPLNGTRRTGFIISVKTSTGADYVDASKDPMISTNGVASVVDRAPAVLPAGFTSYDQYLDYLYDTYFKVTVKTDVDPTNPANWTFKWYPQYYFFGLHADILSGAPYLEQTKGWTSIKGDGTFDPLQ